MSDGASFAFPLCDCVLEKSVFEGSDWHECSHGFHYSKSVTVEYNRVLAQLVSLDARAAELEELALTEHQKHADKGVTEQVKTVASAAAPAAVKTKPIAPVRVKPKRSTPKLSPQQTLLAVAGGLIVIALSVFFGTTWQSLDFLQQAAVLLAVVGLSSWATVVTRRYFAIISNFLAAISSLFMGAGLWVLTRTPDPALSPILALVLLALTAFGWILGKRFKVFGWLFTVPVTFVTAALVLSQGYLNVILQSLLKDPETFNQDAATLRTLLVSFAILAAFVLGRSTLSEFAEVSAAKLAKQKKPDSEPSAQETEYLQDRHKREQTALRLSYRLSALALLIYTGVQFGNLFSSFVSGWRLPNVFLLAALAAFWVAVSWLAPTRLSALFSDAGKYATRIRIVLWYYAAALVGATALDVQAQLHDPLQYMIASIPLAGALLFLPAARIAEKHPGFVGATRFATYAIWSFTALIFAVSPDASTDYIWTTWIALLSLVHGAKAWFAKSVTFAHAFTILAAAASVQFVVTADSVSTLAVSCVLLLSLVVFVAHQQIVKHAGAQVDLFMRVWHPVSSVLVLLLVWRVVASPFEMIWISLGYTLLNFALAFSARYRKELEGTLVITSGISALFGYLFVSSTEWQTVSQLEGAVAIYSLFIFGMSVFYSSKSRFSVSATLAFVPLGVLAVMIGDLVTREFHSTPWHSPVPAALSVLLGFMALVKFASKTSRSFEVAGVSVMALVSGLFVSSLVAGEQSERTLVNGFLVLAGFALLQLPWMLRLRSDASRYLPRTFTLGTSIVATVSAIVLTVIGVPTLAGQQLWLVFAAMAVSTLVALAGLVAKNESSAAKPWSAAALLGAVVTSVAFVNALFMNIVYPISDQLAFAIHLPVVLLLAALLGRRIMLLAKSRDAEFAWAIRPISVFVAGGLTFVSWRFTYWYGVVGYHSTMLGEQMAWVAAAAFIATGLVFTGYRLVQFKDSDASRSAIASQLITIGFGALLLQWTFKDAVLVYAALFGAWALMNAVASWFNRDRFGSVLTFAFGYLGLSALATYLNQTYEIHSLALFSLSVIAPYLLSNLLLSRTKQSFPASWAVVLPAVSAVSFLQAVLVGQLALLVNSGWTDFLVADLIALLYLVAIATPSLKIFGSSRVSLVLASAFNFWLAGTLASLNFAEASTALPQLQLVIVMVSAWFGLLLIVLREARVVTLSLAYLSLASGAFFFAEYLNVMGPEWLPRSIEIYALPIALSAFINSVVGSRRSMFAAKTKPYLLYTLPILLFTVGSSVDTWSYVADPIVSLPTEDLTRFVLLLVGSILILLLGIKRKNRGLTVAGAITFGLNLLPQIWFRIDEFVSGTFGAEAKFIYVAVLLYAALVSLQNFLKWKVSSLVTVGLPVLLGMSPALFDTLGALQQVSLTAEDWVRFTIVLVSSLLLLVVGALRKLSGMFFPGIFGLAVAVLPYLWVPLSQQTWFVWVVLIAAAGLLVWVAIRLEQFKTGVKSAGSWVRELQ